MNYPLPPASSSALGAALDVIVVVPSSPRRRTSYSRVTVDQLPLDRARGGIVASSDFYVSFPSSLAWTTAPKSSLKTSVVAKCSLVYRNSASSLSNGGTRSSTSGGGASSITEESHLEEEGTEVRDGDLSIHSSMSEMGTACTEPHANAMFAHPPPQSRVELQSTRRYRTNDQLLQEQPQQMQRPQSRLASVQNNGECNIVHQPIKRRTGNVQISINGRYIPQLDMVFSAKPKQNTSSRSFLMGGSKCKDGPSCRFVDGNGLRPSTGTLGMLIDDREAYLPNDLAEPTCTCHESIRNSQHHLCAPRIEGDGCPLMKGGGSVLRRGRNLLRYTLLSKNGCVVATAEAFIYLWRSSDSVVVSDVDGTVTKSDVRGVIDTVMQDKFEHCHAGICKFFKDLGGCRDSCNDVIRAEQSGEASPFQASGLCRSPGSEESEVRFLYLSARPISLVGQTRKLLTSLSQRSPTNEMLYLPRGPVMCHTGPLSTVLYSELIAKNIHEFKADVLARQVVVPFVAARGDEWNASRCSAVTPLGSRGSIAGESLDRSLSWSSDASFLWDDRLFLAGFGNKVTDAMAYEMAGMDRCDIFIIDKESRIMCMGFNEGRSFEEGNEKDSFDKSSVSENLTIARDRYISHHQHLAEASCETPALVQESMESTNKAASAIHSIELSLKDEMQTVMSESVAQSRTTVDIYVKKNTNLAGKQSLKRSKMKQSIRAFSSRKSFSTKFPSFSSASSNVSISSPKKLYKGYEDPLLLARVCERMRG